MAMLGGRYAAVGEEALLNADLGVRPADEPVPTALLETPMAPLFAGLARMRDGEEHRTLKAALQRALASCDDTLIQQTAAQCAARLAPKAAEAAAITRFNYGLPVCTLGALLGVPEAQWQHLIDDSPDFVRCIAPAARRSSWHAALRRHSGSVPGWRRGMACCAGPVREIGDARLVSANALGLLFQACEATAGWIGLAYLLARQNGEVDTALDRVRALTPPIKTRAVSSYAKRSLPVVRCAWGRPSCCCSAPTVNWPSAQGHTAARANAGRELSRAAAWRICVRWILMSGRWNRCGGAIPTMRAYLNFTVERKR